MKFSFRTLLLLLCGVMLVSAVACNGTGNEQPTEEPAVGDPTTETPTTEEPTTEEPTTEEPAKPVYKVTFEINGSVFAIQEVREGEKATKPWLRPNPYGFWDWDFEQPITEDTVIYWQIDFAE